MAKIFAKKIKKTLKRMKERGRYTIEFKNEFIEKNKKEVKIKLSLSWKRKNNMRTI